MAVINPERAVRVIGILEQFDDMKAGFAQARERQKRLDEGGAVTLEQKFVFLENKHIKALLKANPPIRLSDFEETPFEQLETQRVSDDSYAVSIYQLFELASQAKDKQASTSQFEGLGA